MHPPLYQAHPLCQKEVEAFTRCHDENPWLKFFNACGDAEAVMNACFREEKALRRQLNREKGPVPFLKIVKRPAAAAEGGEGGAPAAAAPAGASKQQ